MVASGYYGIVSAKLPLISNLSVGENIALIKQYHANMPYESALAEAALKLERLGVGDILLLRD
ncbi:MAG: hypothetical protein K6347_08590, partial [Campylobacterales bacterium]